MGLFRSIWPKEERCPACGKNFQDDHDAYVNHITNIHPKTKLCTKCTGTTYWTHQGHVAGGHAELQYVCVECGFVLESWRVVDDFTGKQFLKEKNRNTKCKTF